MASEHRALVEPSTIRQTGTRESAQRHKLFLPRSSSRHAEGHDKGARAAFVKEREAPRPLKFDVPVALARALNFSRGKGRDPEFS